MRKNTMLEKCLRKTNYKIQAIKKGKNENEGITLITLVITIIVLLILAGVSVMMISGDNSILRKSTDAKEETIIGQEKEQVEMAYVSAAINKLGSNVSAENLQTELDKTVGENKTSTEDNGDNTINVKFYDTQHNYNVNNGKVSKVEPLNWESILEEAKNNPDKYLQLAKEKGQKIEENTVIGIGTDGKVVNMDLWNYYDFGGYYSLGKRMGYNTFYTGYSNSNIINGKIQGTIPIYIKEDEEFYEVKSLQATFYGCTSLEVAPEIPDSVIGMEFTFMGCTKLCGELIINSELTYYDKCLYNAGYDASMPLYLSGNSTILERLLETKGDSTNIFIK